MITSTRLYISRLLDSIKDNGGLLPALLQAVNMARANGFPYLKCKFFNLLRKDFTYETWINTYEPLELIYKKSRSCKTNPMFTIYIFANLFSQDQLQKLLSSIENQSYKCWRIVLTHTNNSKHTLFEPSQQYKLTEQISSGSISDIISPEPEQNICTMFRPTWIICIDSPLVLSKHTLSALRLAIHKYPNSRLVYFDNDHLNKDNKRFLPRFKPDWNKELFYSNGYIGNVVAYDKTSLLNFDFDQNISINFNYYLTLQFIKHNDQASIKHLPIVLSHNLESIVGQLDENHLEKFEKIISEIENSSTIHLSKSLSNGRSLFRVTRKLTSHPLVSIIIPTKDRVDLLSVAVESILTKTEYSKIEIIIVNNNSIEITTKKYFHSLLGDKRIKILDYPHQFNYSAINNFAVNYANGEILGLLNNDIEVISGNWLQEMVSHAQRIEVGCVGAKLYYPNNTIQHAGVITGLGGAAGHSHPNFTREHPGYFDDLMCVRYCTAVTAACLLVRSDIFQEVNGLNEENLAIAFNDVDFCLKVKEAGYENIWTPFAELYHHESVSRGNDFDPDKIKRFIKEARYFRSKWKKYCTSDEYYSSNLNILKCDYTPAFPPRCRFL